MVKEPPAPLTASTQPALPDSEATQERHAFFLMLSDTLRPLHEPEAIQHEACRLLGLHLGATRVLYAESNPDGSSLIGGQYADGVPLLQGPLRLDRFDSSLPEKYRLGRPVVQADVASDPALSAEQKANFAALEIGSYVIVPMMKSGGAVARLGLHYQTAHAWTAEEVQLVEETAERLWAALERAHAQAALRRSEELYRTLFESIDQGFCIIEVLFEGERPVNYRFLEVNPAFEKHSGFKEVVGKTISDIEPNHDLAWAEIYGRIATTGRAERFEMPARALRRFYDVHAFRVGDAAQRRVAILFEDITSRKLTEELLREEADIDAFRVSLNDALHSLSGPMEVQAAAARVLGTYLQASRAAYAEVEAGPESDYYHIRQDYCAPGVASLTGRYRADDFGEMLSDEMHAGRTVVVADVENEPRLTPAARAAYAATGVRAYICVPIIKDGQQLACVLVNHAQPREWRDLDIAVVEETAERTSAAVESARYEHSLRESEERQAFLLALSDAMRSLDSPEEIMETATSMLGRQLRASHVGYAETDHGESYIDVLVGWADYGLEAEPGEHMSCLHREDVINTCRSGLPWVVEDTETDVRPEVRAAADDPSALAGERAILGVPMLKEERWVSLLYATSRAARCWTPEEIDLTREVAERTWSALELVRAQQALQKAKEAAELANQSKDHFLAVLSHELRTPLTPVLMTVDALLQNETLNVQVRDDLAMMKRNIQIETKLIDDLLDVSRITSGKLALHLGVVDLNDVVRNACRICAPLARERGIELHPRMGRMAGVVNADSARVQQVLWNVLMNAIKFTPPKGHITVSTAWLAESGRCEVRVEDSGAGISPELLPHIFNAFEQGGSRVTRQFGGLGLGLAICKALVELHHGSIRAESAGPGQGTTFIIELPGRLMTATTKIRLAAPGKKENEASLRLLLVEDHADTARTLSALLRRASFEVVSVQDVAGAIAAAKVQPFDVLVSDLGLPDGSGYDVVHAVKDEQDIPAVAMSGFGMEEDVRRSRQAGFTEHLVKPIDVTELVATIRRVVAAHARSV